MSQQVETDRERLFESLVSLRAEAQFRAEKRAAPSISDESKEAARREQEDILREEVAQLEEMFALAFGQDIEVKYLDTAPDSFDRERFPCDHAEYWRRHDGDDLVEEAACQAFGFTRIPTLEESCDDSHMVERRAALALAEAIRANDHDEEAAATETREWAVVYERLFHANSCRADTYDLVSLHDGFEEAKRAHEQAVEGEGTTVYLSNGEYSNGHRLAAVETAYDSDWYTLPTDVHDVADRLMADRVNEWEMHHECSTEDARRAVEENDEIVHELERDALRECGCALVNCDKDETVVVRFED